MFDSLQLMGLFMSKETVSKLLARFFKEDKTRRELV